MNRDPRPPTTADTVLIGVVVAIWVLAAFLWVF